MGVKSVIYLLFSAVSSDVCINNKPVILIDIEAPLETDNLYHTENKKQPPKASLVVKQYRKCSLGVRTFVELGTNFQKAMFWGCPAKESKG